MKRLILAMLSVSAVSGCGLQVTGRTMTFGSAAPSNQSSAAPAADPDAAKKEQAAKEQEAAKYAAQKAKNDERRAKANTTQLLALPMFDATVKVRGDLQAKPDGDSAMRVFSEFFSMPWLTVEDAKRDRYGLEERITTLGNEKRGFTVISKQKKPNGSWGVEFSYWKMDTQGLRMGTSYGYFSQKPVGGKVIDCYVFDANSEVSVGVTVDACATLTATK